MHCLPPNRDNQLLFLIYTHTQKRTPVGSFNGVLKKVTAPELGAVAIKAAVEESGIDKNLIQDVYMGNVLQAAVGQSPARQAVIKAGLSQEVEATTINKVGRLCDAFMAMLGSWFS